MFDWPNLGYSISLTFGVMPIMLDDTGPGASPLVRKLVSVYPLTDAERQRVAELPLQVRELRADQDIVREGDRPSRSCLILEGFTLRYKLVGEVGRFWPFTSPATCQT